MGLRKSVVWSTTVFKDLFYLMEAVWGGYCSLSGERRGAWFRGLAGEMDRIGMAWKSVWEVKRWDSYLYMSQEDSPGIPGRQPQVGTWLIWEWDSLAITDLSFSSVVLWASWLQAYLIKVSSFKWIFGGAQIHPQSALLWTLISIHNRVVHLTSTAGNSNTSGERYKINHSK